jgi:hypothetical protein
VTVEGVGVVAGVPAGSMCEAVLGFLATSDADTLEKATLDALGFDRHAQTIPPS